MDIILALFLLAQTADTTTTLVGLQRGYGEANPLIPQHPAGVLLIKAGSITGTIVIYRQFKKQHPKAAKITLGILAGVVGAAAVHNAFQLR